MFFFKQNQHKLPDSNSMVIYKCWPRCKPWQIPPAHIYAWHIEQPASSMHQNPLRILPLILQQDQCRMCVNCCHLSGKVCQRGSTRCNKCEWKYCTINLGHDVACCRKHFLTYRGTFFATVMRKKLPVFTTATFSLWIYNWNIFPWRVVWLLEQHSPTPPPSCVTCSAGSRGFEEKRQKGGSRLRLTCVALAEDSHGLSAHAVHGERVVLWHLWRRILLPRGAQGGQLLAEAEPYLRSTVEGQGRGNTSDVTRLG